MIQHKGYTSEDVLYLVLFSSDTYFQLLKISEDLQTQTPVRRLVAGGLAGTTSVIATYPLDLVRYSKLTKNR